MSGLFWTLILANYTDEELNNLNRWVKWYEDERLNEDRILTIIDNLRGIG